MSAFPVERRMTPDTLAEVAHLRARGHSWESTAREVGWDAPALRRAVRAAAEFDRLYQEAEQEVRREVEAEMLYVFRVQMRDADLATARKAAEAVAKHLAGERRDRTRLDVERLKADTVRAKLDAKRPVPEAVASWSPAPASELTPDEVHQPATERLHARRAANTRAVVWLWGGKHKVGGVQPDATSDVPLVLFKDDTVPGRPLYWAARYPLPADPFDGPPAAGPPEPVPELTPEQVGQLALRPDAPPG